MIERIRIPRVDEVELLLREWKLFEFIVESREKLNEIIDWINTLEETKEE